LSASGSLNARLAVFIRNGERRAHEDLLRKSIAGRGGTDKPGWSVLSRDMAVPFLSETASAALMKNC